MAIKKLIKAVDNARDFPHNTCGYSRHVQIIGAALANGGQYQMIKEEPEHCASSMLFTVMSLYKSRTELCEARTEINRLRAANAHLDALYSAALQDAKRYALLETTTHNITSSAAIDAANVSKTKNRVKIK
jgi:hypothetical protein